MDHTLTPAIQDYYPEDVAHCYGCGRLNPHGLQLKTRFAGDEAIAIFIPRPEHTSVPGFVYGGLIASLIDCHCMAAAAGAEIKRQGRIIGDGPAPRFVTGGLNVRYLKPTPNGVPLEVRAKIKEAGERKFVVEATVTAAGTLTATGEVVAVRMPDTMTHSKS